MTTFPDKRSYTSTGGMFLLNQNSHRNTFRPGTQGGGEEMNKSYSDV